MKKILVLIVLFIGLSVNAYVTHEHNEYSYQKAWAESIGQALYYAFKTGKKPMVILILENPQKEMLYFNRVKKLANAYNFEVQYVTKDILNLDKNNKCSNPKCKCHKN